MADPASLPGVFLHPQSLCESAQVGHGTRVWAFAHVLPGAVIGADCNVCDHVFIENDVVIGDRVTIKSGVQIWDGIHLADDVFVGPNATFSNDKFPRSRRHQKVVQRTEIGRGASIGAGAVILPGIKVGARAMIGAGAVVTHEVPARAVVSGNPARIVGYVDTPKLSARTTTPAAAATARAAIDVRGVSLHDLTQVDDLRGRLAAGEFLKQIPFQPLRYFMVFDVPGKEIRGEHAHRQCHQFLVCIRGHVSVMVDDGDAAAEVELGSPRLGLYVQPMVWAAQFRYSADAILLVFASHHYEAADYIRDYDEFVALLGKTKPVTP